MKRGVALILTFIFLAGMIVAGALASTVEGADAADLADTVDSETPWYEGGATATIEGIPEDDTSDDDEPEQVIGLYRTNILKAEAGQGTGRYTLAISTETPLDEDDPTTAAMAMLVRRLIQLDGSLGDPSDATLFDDIEATKGIDASDVYAVLVADKSIHIYKNGELVVSEGLNPHFTKITYTHNRQFNPALRYTRANGKTALFGFTQGSVILFTGEYVNLTVDYAMKDLPIALGAGCYIEEFHVNSRILIHNSGLIEDSDYPPEGIDMIGIAVDEDENPILIDSGMWSTGPRRVRGRLCKVCGVEYNGTIESQYELHLIHVCQAPDCKYGGHWASCAKEGSKYDPALHGPAPWCPYVSCAVCSDIRCALCQRDYATGTDWRALYFGTSHEPTVITTDYIYSAPALDP
ncbi:hypothetical protein AGMMS49992_12810 [Clostridia bacterium]|nr:hypothetical protein AGMMS49992_12810 [Clostridia bacterium]